MNLVQLLAIAETLRGAPMSTIGMLQQALKDGSKIATWDEVFHENMAEAIKTLETEMQKQGLILPGVDMQLNQLRKMPGIQDALNPKPKKKR